MFTMYNGRTNPVEHVSHFNQRMTVHSKNEALMCKVFPSSLGPVAIRWFDGLEASSIDSFKELTQAFGFCFITSSRVPQPLDSLLSLSMKEGEILKTYSNKYWQQGKGKAKVIPKDKRDFKSNRYNNNKPRRDFPRQSGSTASQVVNTVFQELVHQVLEKIKNEPYFKWPNKMGGDPMRHNKAFTANTTKTEGTPQRIVELFGVIWVSWSKKEG